MMETNFTKFLKPGVFEQPDPETGEWPRDPEKLSSFLLLKGGPNQNVRDFGFSTAVKEAVPELRRIQGRWFQISRATEDQRTLANGEKRSVREFLGGAIEFSPHSVMVNVRREIKGAKLAEGAMIDPRPVLVFGDELVEKGLLSQEDFQGRLGGDPERVLFITVPSAPNDEAGDIWYADRARSEGVADDALGW